MKMDEIALDISVVLLPLPAQGHLNQLLHLGRRLSDRNIPVHYVGSHIHNRQARDRAHITTSNLHFHDFPLHDFHQNRTQPATSLIKSTTHFPTQLQPAFDSALSLAGPLTDLLLSLSKSSRRVILIHDSMMSFASGILKRVKNAESFVYHSVSAYSMMVYYRGVSLEGCFSEEFMEFIKRQHEMAVTGTGRLMNTCRAIEGEFVDRLAEEPSWHGQKVFAIGPVHPVHDADESKYSTKNVRHPCLEWLDGHPPSSVLYVSFGTNTSLPEAQLLSLASALSSSPHPFLWALRHPDISFGPSPPTDLLLKVPVDINSHHGLVVSDWAPQVDILAHPAVGGFLSHCGWNSCMESMSMGVPILTWPMHSDQPWNAELVTDVLGMGMPAREWAHRNEKEVVPAEELEEKIRMFMKDDGEIVRVRAREVRDRLREEVIGGNSRKDFDAFVHHILRH